MNLLGINFTLTPRKWWSWKEWKAARHMEGTLQWMFELHSIRGELNRRLVLSLRSEYEKNITGFLGVLAQRVDGYEKAIRDVAPDGQERETGFF